MSIDEIKEWHKKCCITLRFLLFFPSTWIEKEMIVRCGMKKWKKFAARVRVNKGSPRSNMGEATYSYRTPGHA